MPAKTISQQLSPMVILHGVWMVHYRGWEPNIYAGGFKWPAENEWAGEIFNFDSVAGRCYGHVEVLGKAIRLENLGAAASDDRVDGVLVVWTAPNPTKRGRTIIGWYRNATLHRRRVNPKGSLRQARRFQGHILSYQVEADANDCRVLDVEQRVLTIPPRKRTDKGLPGQMPIYYPLHQTNPAARKLERQIRAFIETGAHEALGAKGKARSYQPDPERRKQIETKAIELVWEHFETLGYALEDHQDANVGYDLVANKGDERLCIEVKGRAGAEVIGEFSPNEYEKIKLQEDDAFPDGSYRICIVTSALSENGRPQVHHFNYWRSGKWCKIDDVTHSLTFDELVAARATLG